jgi:hypothetical protein
MRCDVYRGIGSIIVLSVALAAAASARAAGAARAGDATFTPPDDWAVNTQPDGLVRIVSPDQNAMILVMPGNPYDGDLQDAFDKSWASLRQGFKVKDVVKGGEAEAGKTEGGYEFVSTDATLRDAGGKQLACRYMLLRSGTSMCGLAYIGTPAAFKEFDATYDDFAGGFELKRRRDAKPADGVAEAPADAPADAGKQGKPAPEPPKLEPNTVAGRITDARGNIIEDARLLVQVSGTTLAGERTNFDIEVDENGLFSQEVPDGLWRIYGFIEKEYNGHKYRLPLDPEDKREIGSTQGTRKGVVKNFVWKVAGLKPKADKTLPGSYYGGSIDLTDVQVYNEGRRLVDRYPGAKVVVTLKPKGILIDGSQGKPVKVEADVAAADALTRPMFMDIPLGEYVATAQLVAPNGASRPLNIAMGFVRFDAPGRSASAVVAFYPPSAFETLKTVSMSVWE